MNKSLLIVLAVFFVLIFTFISCNNFENDGLRYGFTTEPTTLDPLNPSNTADGRSILFNVFEGLVKPKTDGTFMPCIAETWTIEQNGLLYNFTLRNGVRFSDGSLLTAADVKFSIDTAAAAGFNGLNNIEQIVITQDNQISIILKTIDPEFLPYLTVGIVKADNTDREKNVIGTGPFYIERYRPQRNLILAKNNFYWQNNLPYLDKITLVFFANFDSLMTALRGRSIDGAFITGSMAAQLDHRDFEINQNSSAAVQLLALNNEAAPLNDIRVRRAINYAINVQEVIDSAFFGAGTPSGSPIIPGLSIYYEDTPSVFNPELARSLLSQAGFNNVNRLSLEITVPSNFTMHVDTAQVIVSQLERIGVNASIKLVDWPTWLSEVYIARQYQATIISLDSPSVSPRGFLCRYHSNDSGNFINFKNAEFDSIYETVLTETNNTRRIRLYKDAQRIITENAASVYLQDIYYFIVLRGNNYGGVLDYPLYVIDFASIFRINNN